MRIQTIAGISALALGLLTASGAMAAPSSSDSLSGTPAASMTCGQFTQLAPEARRDLIKQIDANAPATSLTSNSGSGNTMAAGSGSTSVGNSTDAPGSTAGALGINTPLNGGQLISACEGASPSSTLEDAFSHANSGNSPAALGK